MTDSPEGLRYEVLKLRQRVARLEEAVGLRVRTTVATPWDIASMEAGVARLKQLTITDEEPTMQRCLGCNTELGAVASEYRPDQPLCPQCAKKPQEVPQMVQPGVVLHASGGPDRVALQDQEERALQQRQAEDAMAEARQAEQADKKARYDTWHKQHFGVEAPDDQKAEAKRQQAALKASGASKEGKSAFQAGVARGEDVRVPEPPVDKHDAQVARHDQRTTEQERARRQAAAKKD